MVRALLLALALLAQAGASAQPAVRIIVPYATGGPNDTLARVLAEPLASLLGQPVVVENKPGANSAIGAEWVAKAAPDGRTLLLAGSNISIGQALGQYRFDPRKDLAPVVHIGHGEYFLLASAASGITSVDSLRAFAAAKPQGLNCGAGGSQMSLICEFLRLQLGGASTTITYSGMQPAMFAMMSGQLDVMFAPRGSVLPVLQNNKVRVVASASRTPSAAPLDQLPLLARTWPEMAMHSDIGIFAPAGTPEATLKSLNAAINTVLARQPVRDAIQELGFSVVGGPPQALADWLVRDVEHFQALARRMREQGGQPRW